MINLTTLAQKIIIILFFLIPFNASSQKLTRTILTGKIDSSENFIHIKHMSYFAPLELKIDTLISLKDQGFKFEFNIKSPMIVRLYTDSLFNSASSNLIEMINKPYYYYTPCLRYYDRGIDLYIEPGDSIYLTSDNSSLRKSIVFNNNPNDYNYFIKFQTKFAEELFENALYKANGEYKEISFENAYNLILQAKNEFIISLSDSLEISEKITRVCNYELDYKCLNSLLSFLYFKNEEDSSLLLTQYIDFYNSIFKNPNLLIIDNALLSREYNVFIEHYINYEINIQKNVFNVYNLPSINKYLIAKEKLSGDTKFFYLRNLINISKKDNLSNDIDIMILDFNKTYPFKKIIK